MHSLRIGLVAAAGVLVMALAGAPGANAQENAKEAIFSMAMKGSQPQAFCLGTNGTLGACTPSANRFTKKYEARNAFVFETSAGTCLEGAGGNGQRVRLAPCNSELTQDWYITGNGRIQNKANNLCLDVQGERYAMGTPVILWGCSDGKNQTFAVGVVMPRSDVPPSAILSGNELRRLINAGKLKVADNRVIAAGGGNVIGNATANFLGNASGNVIAAGGGNVIAAGGANAIGESTPGAIAAGGGNFIGNASGTATAPADGSTLIGQAGSNAIAAGGGNVIGNATANYTTLSSSNPAASGQLSVDAQSNIFAAGRSSVPDMPYGGGLLPEPISVSGASSVSFSSITGAVNCCQMGELHGPDGGTDFVNTDINSFEGIGGVIHESRTLFLVGLFLSDAPPSAPAPERLNVTAANDAATSTPALGQVFFIGDGKDSQGAEQRFAVPAGATRLFLGFADALGSFKGDPGAYGDNRGTLAVSYQIY